MRAPILLLLLGCRSTDPSAPLTDPGCVQCTTSTTPPPSTPDAPPAFVEPAEAVDLDPAPDQVRIQLTAAPHGYEVAGEWIDGYAYNEQVPGPTIRATVGDTLTVEFANLLDAETTVHWHGLAVPWEMDGVTWMQEPVAPSGAFVYQFTLTQAGTFWYHPHVDSEQQVDLGLYGALIVEDPSDPVVPDTIWVLDTWGEAPETEEIPTGAAHTHGVDATARTWTVNSVLRPLWQPQAGAVHRVRILNTSNVGYLHLRDLSWLGSDQGLRPSLEVADLVLGPGDRADVEWVMDQPAEVQSEPYAAVGGPAWGDPIPLLSVEPQGDGTPTPPAWDLDGALPSPDPGTTDLLFTLQGDPETQEWMINGEQFPYITVPALALDTEAVIEVRNLSAAEHPFHLHGHAFEVLSVDGTPPTWKTVEDTWNVRIRETVRLRWVADNPGDWMAHCHILPHLHGGMMTVITVQ